MHRFILSLVRSAVSQQLFFVCFQSFAAVKYRSTVNETLRVTLNENASNFESFNGDKHHIPDAVYEINSQFFSYFFFQYLWFLAVEIKRDYKDYPVKLVHGKAPKFVREV